VQSLLGVACFSRLRACQALHCWKWRSKSWAENIMDADASMWRGQARLDTCVGVVVPFLGTQCDAMQIGTVTQYRCTHDQSSLAQCTLVYKP
jgi:hypothetical protein